MEDGTPNGQGYNRCGFVEECTRYEREVKSRQEKAKTETRRDGFETQLKISQASAGLQTPSP